MIIVSVLRQKATTILPIIIMDVAINLYSIKEFMSYYRTTFPEATVLPKMHILEDHVVDWIRKWEIGSGLMGEQGAESIHAHLNLLEAQFRGIRTVKVYCTRVQSQSRGSPSTELPTTCT